MRNRDSERGRKRNRRDKDRGREGERVGNKVGGRGKRDRYNREGGRERIEVGLMGLTMQKGEDSEAQGHRQQGSHTQFTCQ